MLGRGVETQAQVESKLPGWVGIFQPGGMLYSCLVAAVTNYHKFCGKFCGSIKITEMYSLILLAARSAKSRCERGPAPSSGSGKGPPWPPPASGGSRHPLTCGSTTPVTWPSLHLSLSPLLSLVRTRVIGFRPHLENPE